MSHALRVSLCEKERRERETERCLCHIWFDYDADVVMFPVVTPSHKQSIVRPELNASVVARMRACVQGRVGGLSIRPHVF